MFIWKGAAVLILICVKTTFCAIRDFSICQDDFLLDPPDGVLKVHTFPWLGFMQYIHVTTSLPHHSKAPRVVLVHRQFAIGTATDLLHLPKNYKLGNVVFGDYERDEEECGLSRDQIKMGMRCQRAYIEIPLLEIIPHPEFTRFGVGNSLALVKLIRPMKSQYMIPICLPSLVERARKKKHRIVYLIDYISTVPKDFDSERMAKKTLRLYIYRECKRIRMKAKLGSEGITQVLCSSGCGVRPGAPIITHAVGGSYEVMGLAAGGAACHSRSMRGRLNTDPPIYIDVYPYITWIINVITANVLPHAYPQNFVLTDSGSHMRVKEGYTKDGYKIQKHGWKARTYMSGDLCFKSLKKQKASAIFFYSEKFEVNADPPAKLNLIMKIHAGPDCVIRCARLMMPNRLTVPNIIGVGHRQNITVEFSTEWFPFTFYFALALDGRNASDSERKRYDKDKYGYLDSLANKNYK